MNKSKKGDMSINIIIVAILALIVLVVLITIFTGKLGSFRKTSDTCATNAGTCIDATVGCNVENYEKQITGNCFTSDGKTIDTTKVCCVKT